MSYVVGEMPYMHAFLRREYTRGLQDGHGEYYPCVVYGIRAVRGFSLQFQCVLTERHGGANFLAPIEAFCWKESPPPKKADGSLDMDYIQPWDTFSSDFGVHEFSFLRRMKCLVLPQRKPARYRFTIDFIGSDLAEDDLQHKHLHVVHLEDGQIGAFPNNRLLMCDPAFWETLTERPDFIALGGEYLAE